VVKGAKLAESSEGQPFTYKGKYLAGMQDAEYKILGCRNQGADAVCCTTTQRVARGLAKRLVKRTRGVDQKIGVNKIQVQLNSTRRGPGIWSRPVSEENLTHAAWQAIGVEAKGRKSGKVKGQAWGSKAEKDLISMVTEFMVGHEVDQKLPTELVRTVAALCATTVVVAMDPLNGSLPHLPWHLPGARTGNRHTGFGEITQEKSLSKTANWAGKSILVYGIKNGRRSREASDPIRCGIGKLCGIVEGLKEPTRIVQIKETGGRTQSPLCLVTACKNGRTLEVIMIENEAAMATRPISYATISRLCSEHNEKSDGAEAMGWKMHPPSRRSRPQGKGKDRPIPRNRPRLPSARGFSVAAMIYETMDPTIPRDAKTYVDGKVQDYASEPIGLARMGILPRGVKRMLRDIGFKDVRGMTTRIREEVLWSQYRRIRSKRGKRAYHVFDDMG
jgi:hypothetical protein